MLTQILMYSWFVLGAWSEGVTFHTTVPAASYLYSVDNGPWLPALRSRCREQKWLDVQQWECYVTLPRQYYGFDRQLKIRAVDGSSESNVMNTRYVVEFLPECDAMYADLNGEMTCYPRTDVPVITSCPVRDNAPDDWCVAYWQDDSPVLQPQNVIIQ